MRAILAYSNSALPETADEGQSFINITTEETLIFHNGKWESLTEPKTPSTPKKVLSDSAIAEPEKAEEPVVEEKPKKTTAKKAAPKKEKK